LVENEGCSGFDSEKYHMVDFGADDSLLSDGWDNIPEAVMQSVLSTLEVDAEDVQEEFGRFRELVLLFALTVLVPNGYDLPLQRVQTTPADRGLLGRSRSEYLELYASSIRRVLGLSVSDSSFDASPVTNSAIYYSFCVERLVYTTLQVALALEGQTEGGAVSDVKSAAVEEDQEDSDASPFTVLDVEEDSTAKEIIGNAGLPFGTGSAFYEVVKSESVSKAKLIVVYEEKTNKWLEGDDARKMIGLSVGKDGKVNPKDGFRVFVQSTSPNRKIPAGTGLLYKREAAISKSKPTKKQTKKKKKRGGSDDEEDEMDVDDEGGNSEDGPISAADMANRGKLNLLSFFAASGTQRAAVAGLMNRLWFTDYLCRTNMGPDHIDAFAITQYVKIRLAELRSDGTPVDFSVGLNVEGQSDLGYEYFRTECSVYSVKEYQMALNLAEQRRCSVTTVTADPSVQELGSIPSEIGMVACDLIKLFEQAKSQGDQRKFSAKGRIDNASHLRAAAALRQRFLTIYGESEAPLFVKTQIEDSLAGEGAGEDGDD
jgi:hypothetical protein